MLYGSFYMVSNDPGNRWIILDFFLDLKKLWNYSGIMQFLLNLWNFFQVYFWEVFAPTICTPAFTGKSEYGPKIGLFYK